MALVARDLQGGVSHWFKRYKVDANVVAGQFVIRSTSVASAGEVVDPTTVAAAHVVGVAPNAVTYSAVGAELLTNLDIREGRTTSVVLQPFALYDLLVSGGTVSGTALSATPPANIITTTGTSQTVIAATEVGAISHAGGTMYGLTGNNASQSRRITAHTDNVSETVEVPFRYAVVAGDVFMRLPYSLATRLLTLTSDFGGANGIAAIAGAAFAPVLIEVDIVRRTASVQVLALDHMLSALA